MFGNQLYLYMYQPINDITGQKILRTIREMLDRWQPRIVIDNIQMQVNIDQLSYLITLNFSVPSIEAQDSIQLLLEKDNIFI